VITTDVTPQEVVHTATGETTLAQVTDAMNRWYSADDFDPDIPVLWDLRSARLGQATTGDVEAWTESSQQVINQNRAGRKTAWVFGSVEALQVAVELLGEHDWQHRVRFFNDDMEAARVWLHSTIR
jgi:hypothetical protein